MRKLSQGDVERLMLSNRRLIVSFVLVMGSILVGMTFLTVRTGESVRVVGGGGFGGALIAYLLLLPQRSLGRKMGITPAEARAAIQAEKERRNPRAKLSAQETVRRARKRSALWLTVGWVSVVVLIFAAAYFIIHAGATVEEDAPTDPWFAASCFVGFVALVMAPVAFTQAKHSSITAQRGRTPALGAS